jgi:predicted transcriptional regulator
MTATTISFRTDLEKKEQLDKIAQSLDRDRSWVINEALSNYLDLQRWQQQQIEKGLQALNEGRTISHEEMKQTWRNSRRRQPRDDDPLDRTGGRQS